MQRRTVRALALALGLSMTVAGSVLLWQGARESEQKARNLDETLNSSVETSSLLLAEHFERAVSADLQLAGQPAYADFYRAPGSTVAKIEQNIAPLRDAQRGLLTIEELFPKAVSEACFIDLNTGREIARVVDGEIAPVDDLSPDESEAIFFAPTKEGQLGVPYQSLPYESEDSGLWVIATSTQVAVDGQTPAMVHFETSIESLRRSALLEQPGVQLRVVDADTGAVVMDGGQQQAVGAPLGVPDDQTFMDVATSQLDEATTTLGEERVAFARPPDGITLEADNDKNWVVAASAPVIPVGLMANLTPLIVALLAIGVPLLVFGLADLYRANRQRRRDERFVAEERDKLDARMNDLSAALAEAASGNLDVTCAFDLGDERMTALAQAFDVTLSHLRSLVTQAQASSTRLSQSAAELRASSAQQAASATEQSTAVMQTTATVEELAATAAQIAETASGVAESATETLGLTEEGLAAVRDSVSAMDRMTGTAEAIASSSALLGDKVNEIGRILALIDELSEQTNLLALNAAIEAARAGEHGRGFAVVAAEVRKLAERAQQSTAQIQGLVTEIQAHTQNTVLASEEGAREASHGVQVAGSAVSALDRIATMVDETTTAVAEISVATQQQRSASDQVVVAMGQVAEVAGQFAAGSSQVASSAQSISALADEFEESISSFGVAEDASDSVLDPSWAESAEIHSN
jgi:methyl-accepting chemotaxis protein